VKIFNSLVVGLCCALCCTSGLAQTTRLTSGSGGGERQPVINADGTLVAYVAMSGASREVFTVPTSGGSPTRRTTGADVRIGSSTFDSWPSLSISDTGNRIAYWNGSGVHVLDLTTTTDVVVASANLLAYPQISEDGGRVVYQATVGTALEVFVVPASGGTPQQLTNASGPGRRLPHLVGSLVVMQRSVAGAQEVFVYDLTTNTLTPALTSASGRGNRYARLSRNGVTIAYEAVVGAMKQVCSYDLSTRTQRQVTTQAASGDRAPSPTLDGEAFYEVRVANLDVLAADLANSAVATYVTGARGGHRRPSVDEYGSVFAYQDEYQGACEVFVTRICYVPGLSRYGVHGTPSVGTLKSRDGVYRRAFGLGIGTSLGNGTPAVLLLGTVQTNTPLPNAPGNFVYTQPLVGIPLTLDASGAALIAITSPVTLQGSTCFAQWGISDPAANAFGWVTSQGSRVDFR